MTVSGTKNGSIYSRSFFSLRKADRFIRIRFMKISDISRGVAMIRKHPNNQKGRSEYAAKCLYL